MPKTGPKATTSRLKFLPFTGITMSLQEHSAFLPGLMPGGNRTQCAWTETATFERKPISRFMPWR